MKIIKRIAFLLACIGLVFSGVNLTLALSPNPAVVYDGAKKAFSFWNVTETDLFPSFKDVIPGDRLTQKITLRCQNISTDTELFLKARVDDGVDLPEEIRLDVYYSDRMISSGPADETAGLTEYVKLGTFSSDGEQEITVVLTVPTSVDNEISNVRKNVDWIFAVRVPGENINDVPDTGDNSMIGRYVKIMILSLLGIMLLTANEFRVKKTKMNHT